MSSSADLTFDEGEEITLERWTAFAARHELVYDPHVVGQDTYRSTRSPVEVWFGKGGYCPPPGPSGRIDFSACRPPSTARRVVFSTYWMGAARGDVAALAIAAWHEFGGALDADEEIRRLIRHAP